MDLVENSYICLMKRLDGKMRSDATINGLGRHPLYNVWYAMLQRCNDPSNKSYTRYGERGIKVCENWHDFLTFFEWAEPRWVRGLRIDRKNNDGNYEPDNCHFVTPFANANNRHNSRRIEGLTIIEFAKRHSLNRNTVNGRFTRGKYGFVTS